MNFVNLIKNSVRHYKNYYRLIAFAAVVTVAVIAGSIVIGDSVRSTLVKRVHERLGDTETVIFAQQSFLDSSIINSKAFQHNVNGVLLSNGFISASGRLVPVMVWGVDNLSILNGIAKINASLAKELSIAKGSDIVLRLPATGLVPSGSLFVTDNYTTSLRLTFDGIVESGEGGNLSLKNEQAIPYNIFVNRSELALAMGVDGKINLILSDNAVTQEDFNKIWNSTFSGVKTIQKEGFTEIITDRIFIADKALQTLCANNANCNRLFSYLVNSIHNQTNSIPYSFVTALDEYNGKPIDKDEIILSDYAANRLNAKLGDTLMLTFYTSQNLKTLQTDSLSLTVSNIVPLQHLFTDSTLSAQFPGLSDVDNCTDWDSDLPINMDLITKEDEKYWGNYKTTPKALIAYNAIANKWSNSYGSATGIRIKSKGINLNGLTPDMFGVQLINPKEVGLTAAKSGVDFASLFLSLGFFIIVSAMLLMLVPLSAMINERRREIALLKSLGYTNNRIVKLLWYESAPTVIIASFVGVIFGLIYTYLVLFLLGTVWKGATHTDGFSVSPNLTTLLIGVLIGVILSMTLLRLVIVGALKNKTTAIKTVSIKQKLYLALVSSIVALLVVFANLIFIKLNVLFIIVGVIIIATAAFWGDYFICRNGAILNKTLNLAKLVWATLYASRKQVMLSFFTLTMGIFIVFSVGLNRKDFSNISQLSTATGGYSLWCESSVPVYHNISTQEGREKLALTELPVDVQVLQLFKYSADDASCLNLNKVTQPTVLGVDMLALQNSDFKIENCISSINKSDVFEQMQYKIESAYPVLVDATVLTWGLMLNIGDTIVYEGSKGRLVTLKIIGTLQNSVFQGNLLISRNLFSEIWDEIAGSELMLVKTREDETNDTKVLLSRALSNYGVNVQTTADKLKEFNSVTDTYLTIFMTLGGLGLLLGIMSFIIVVRKNLASRKSEIALYRTIGFTDKRIEKLLYKENTIVPVYAIVTGVFASFVAINTGFLNAGIYIWILALLFISVFIACALFFVKRSVQRCLLK